MNCYNYSDVPAVGCCKACNKGLCHDCVVDLGHGLACKGVHEELVETYNSIIENNAKVYNEAGVNWQLAPIFCILIGLLFSGYGAHKTGLMSFTFIVGIIFIVFGVIGAVKAKSLLKK